MPFLYLEPLGFIGKKGLRTREAVFLDMRQGAKNEV
jgi:hypothetical protein